MQNTLFENTVRPTNNLQTAKAKDYGWGMKEHLRPGRKRSGEFLWEIRTFKSTLYKRGIYKATYTLRKELRRPQAFTSGWSLDSVGVWVSAEEGPQHKANLQRPRGVSVYVCACLAPGVQRNLSNTSRTHAVEQKLQWPHMKRIQCRVGVGEDVSRQMNHYSL